MATSGGMIAPKRVEDLPTSRQALLWEGVG